MKRDNKALALLPLGLVLLGFSALAYADGSDTSDDVVTYTLKKVIGVPGDLSGGFDISWADSESGRYYLANRGNATATPAVPPSITVVNARKLELVYAPPAYPLGGIPVLNPGNGVVTVRKSGDDDGGDGGDGSELWVGTNNSYVEVIDLAHPFAAHLQISTKGTARADELAVDPVDGIVVIANDRDNPPYLTFLSTKTHTVLGQLSYPQAVFGTPATNHGLEQTVWDRTTKMFYLAVPATSTNPNGEIDQIDPIKMTVTAVFPTTCNPAGLVLVPKQQLVTSCGDVVKISTGKVVTTIPKVGADEIWFDSEEGRVVFATGISASVADIETYQVVATFTVGQAATATTPAHTTHSSAVDSDTGNVFIPVSHEGVKVYRAKGGDD